MSEPWKPSVTVAAVVEREGRFLLVEELANGVAVFNQPAGHWERGETLAEACAREALEETGYRFRPTALVGVYRWHFPARDVTFLRFAFCGEVTSHALELGLDREILRAVWLLPEEIAAVRARHRSPLVQACVEDYLAGRRYPLELLRHYE
ncbi:MAG: NUDIX hydrolase [Burkholderiales bacterium]|nr:NUDIX hydrolase [Burkholderiales bacterium]